MNPLLSYHVYHNDDAQPPSFVGYTLVARPVPGSRKAEREADLAARLAEDGLLRLQAANAFARTQVEFGKFGYIGITEADIAHDSPPLSLGDAVTSLQMQIAVAFNIPFDMLIAEPDGRITIPGGMVRDTQVNRAKLAQLQYEATLEDTATRYDGTLSCLGNAIKAWLGKSFHGHPYSIMENRPYEIDVTVAMGYQPYPNQLEFAQMNMNDYIDRYRVLGVRVNLILSPAVTL